MKSKKCVSCGFVGWSDVEICKACGASLNTYHDHGDQPEGQEKGLAIFGLVLGIIGFFTLGIVFVGAIAGTIVSAKAMGRVKREPWRYVVAALPSPVSF